MFCKNCGKDLKEGENFCSNCGYKIDEVKNVTESTTESPKKKEDKKQSKKSKSIFGKITGTTKLKELQDLKNRGVITEEEFKKSKNKLFFKICTIEVLAFVLLFVILYGGITLKNTIDARIEKSKEVSVPNVVGKTLSQAKEELAGIELNIEAKYPTLYSDSPEAIIQSQDNKEGDILKKGSTLRVIAKTQEQLDKEKQEQEERERKAAEAKEKGYRSSPASTETIKRCAQTLIDNNLRSSSTARWGTCEKIDEDNYGRCLVYVSLEAQNGYGAYSKLNYLVILQYVKSNGEFTYKPYSCMYELTTFTGQNPYDYYVSAYKAGNVYPVIKTFLNNNDWNIRPTDA